jgi:hypothetical protein
MGLCMQVGAASRAGVEVGLKRGMEVVGQRQHDGAADVLPPYLGTTSHLGISGVQGGVGSCEDWRPEG